MSLKAVIFDLDNTLMDRDWTFQKFAEQLAEECLVAMDSEAHGKIVAYMIESDADGYRDKDGFFRELIETLPWERPLAFSELKAYYDRHYMSHAKVMDHALEALRDCRSLGFKLGIVTNGHSHLQHGKIDLLKLREHFDTIVVSGDVELKKPDPKIYRLVIERLGVLPEEAVFVGDHPRNDIWGASQIGIRGIWLRRKHPWDKELEGGRPWRSISGLNELVDLFPLFEENMEKD